VIRIAGVNIPRNKTIYIALTYIYGIGKSRSNKICRLSNINLNAPVCELNESSIRRIRKSIDNLYLVEGDLKFQISLNIKNLIEINSYRGARHSSNLPVRGQRTHTNARTNKNKRLFSFAKKNIKNHYEKKK
jgi:small subunit ribosomal protein S13